METVNLTPYQFSVIRYYHDTSTDEFINIGVAIYAPGIRYFNIRISTKYSRIKDAFFNLDGEKYRAYIGKLDRRFEQLKRDLIDEEKSLFPDDDRNLETLLRINLRRDSNFQYSIPASGISRSSTEFLELTLSSLFTSYVEKYQKVNESTSRDEDEIWKTVFKPEFDSQKFSIVENLQSRDFITPVHTLSYDYAWKNENWHILQPVSFDLMKPEYLINKAEKILGRNYLLNENNEVSQIDLLLGLPKDKGKEIETSYGQARQILRSGVKAFRYGLQLIEEDEIKDYATELSTEMESVFGTY